MRGGFVVAVFTAAAIAVACASFSEAEPVSDGGVVPANDAMATDGASADAGERCNRAAPFSSVNPLPPLINTEADETYAALSADELTIYISRAGGGGRDLLVATRGSRDVDFGEPQLVPGLDSSGVDDGLTVSADGLLGVFHSNRSDAAAPMNLFFVTRSSPTVPFGVPQPITNVNSLQADTDAYLLPDKRRVYFGSQRTSPASIFVAAVTASSTTYTFGTPTPLTELTAPNGVGTPVVSSDEHEIFFAAGLPNQPSRIFRATRLSASAPFGAAVDMTELNIGLTVPSWLSADGCVLYLSSDRGGNRDIFVATRGK
jgi:hypothetical protein